LSLSKVTKPGSIFGPMALKTVLAQLCPQPDGNCNTLAHNLHLAPCTGDMIPCHEELLRARCPGLPAARADGVVDVDADRSPVFVLLRWIYAEALDLRGFPQQNLGNAVVRLAFAWELRDAGVLRERFVGSWRRERHIGSLAQDVRRAYDSGAWGSHFIFQAIEAASAGRDTTPLSGGWPLLLRTRSTYFEAMLGGKWAETNGEGDRLGAVKIHWPSKQLAKLVQFLHGHPFVEGMGDLQAAVECSEFFGIPSLIAEVNDWVASNLKLANAPTLWEFVDKEPRLFLGDGEEQREVADANDACLHFHIRHFAELAQDPEEGDGSWVPLHDLSCSLMTKLLATGLICMPKDALTEVVERFACAKCGGKHGIEYANLLQSFRPPAVLFNREFRDMLVGTVVASIHTIL